MEQGTPIRLKESSHVVHFYDSEAGWVEIVAAYLSAATLEGDAVIVIASPEHRAAIRSCLTGAGADPDTAEGDGRLTVLDADEMLSCFMVDGRPQPSAFDAAVGSLVRQAASAGRPVRAYGEMVARLWAEGNVAGAVALERLWNELAEQIEFGLFCAYPRRFMEDEGVAGPFSEVCALHSHVVAGAPEPEGAEVRCRFVATPSAARLARRFVADTLSDWQHPAGEDDAVIAVGEMAANAVQHGGRDFTVGIARRPGGLRLMVGDTSASNPLRRRPRPLSLGGRGLLMLDRLSDAWGYDTLAGGKVVWIDLPSAAVRGRPEPVLPPFDGHDT